MQKSNGPSCPQCGCQDSRLVRAAVRWGKPFNHYRCGNCAFVFKATPPPPPEAPPEAQQVITPQPPQANSTGAPDHNVVTYHVLRCPHCHSQNVRTTSTRRPTRYHKCADCANTFRSFEQ